MTDIVLLPGDGIGPEIVKSVCTILDKAGADLCYHTYDIGQTSYDNCGKLIPEETLEAIENNDIVSNYKGENVKYFENNFSEIIRFRPR